MICRHRNLILAHDGRNSAVEFELTVFLGGEAKAQERGWLKDRYGVSWQIVAAVLVEMMADPDAGKAGRVMEAMLQMKKLDIPGLTRAHAG